MRPGADRHPFLAPTVVLLAVLGTFLAGWVAAQKPKGELDRLVTPTERTFLMKELTAIKPPEAVRKLTTFQELQTSLGGGFYGLMPKQLTDAAAIPVPSASEGREAAALLLARLRQANLDAIEAMKGGYPTRFSGAGMPPLEGKKPKGMRLVLDDSAVKGFLEALADGKVTRDEARRLAALPANREMLRHRAELGYVPPPLPTEQSLAEMIFRAGSPDPLDRLWCWINPHNDFDYADLVQHHGEYRRLLDEVDSHKTEIEGAVLARVAAFAPAGQQLDAQIDLTAESWIRGWATSKATGINIENFKDHWQALLHTVTHETYHRLQLRMCPARGSGSLPTFDDLTTADLNDPGLERFYQAVAYTVLEGTASLVGSTSSTSTAGAGERVLEQIVATAVVAGNTEAAEKLIGQGLRSNGPLYALGLYCARLVSKTDGTAAVGSLLAQGPERLMLRAAELDAATDAPLLTPSVLATLHRLEKRLHSKSQ